MRWEELHWCCRIIQSSKHLQMALKLWRMTCQALHCVKVTLWQLWSGQHSPQNSLSRHLFHGGDNYWNLGNADHTVIWSGQSWIAAIWIQLGLFQLFHVHCYRGLWNWADEKIQRRCQDSKLYWTHRWFDQVIMIIIMPGEGGGNDEGAPQARRWKRTPSTWSPPPVARI